MDVKIRYNTDYPLNTAHKWRLIVDGVEHLVDSIEINCKSHTTDDAINVKAKKLAFSTKKETKKAIVS